MTPELQTTSCAAERIASSPPVGSDFSHLKPSNRLGTAYVAACGGLTALAVFLSGLDHIVLWLLGQILLAFALLQWFVILHECGHNGLFRTVSWNRWAGRLAAYFALIPFACWKRVHGIHHRWTGWQDLDVTTATLVPRKLAWVERTAINICWRLWLPLFSIFYRLNNFWNLPRLFRHFPHPRQRRQLTIGIVLLLAAYIATVWLVGFLPLLRIAGIALLLTLIVQDPLILSQHTHVPLQLSHGETVRPFIPTEQEVFTRSLRFPSWLSTALLGIDAHELHHMYPRIPGYRLRQIRYVTHNEMPWWGWLRKAKQLPGEVFLYSNRNQSGTDI